MIPEPILDNPHDHDWRIDPRTMFANGQMRIVCAICGDAKAAGDIYVAPSNDPKDWPKWSNSST